jgi:hypothetical protein
MKIRTAALAAALATLLGLGACETATPYQPLQKGTATSGGFADQQLDGDHFRVTFQGNTETSRATVENYLLYRAAQLTVAQGFDWFEMVDHHTDRDMSTYVNADPFWGPGFWAPDWRWGGAYGWGAWGPWGGWGGGYSVQNSQSFEATAEIVVRHGPKPATDPRAFDARQVLTNLGPHIILPTPKK